MEGPEREAYERALFEMRLSCFTMDEVRSREQVVNKAVDKFGKLLLFGDQLTVSF